MQGWGYVILIVGAIVIGALAQYLVREHLGYEGIVTAIGAGIGGYVGGAFHLGGLAGWGTAYYGLAIFPALIGGLIIAAAVEVVMYYALRAPAAS